MQADLTGAEFRIILAIIDKTWGFKKVSASISVPAIMESTGLKERTVRDSILNLKSRRIIHYEPGTRVQKGAPLNEFLFNKHYDTWTQQGCKRAHRCALAQGIDTKGRTPLSSIKETSYIKELSSSQLDSGQPENPKPEPKPAPVFLSDSIEIRLSEYLFKHIVKNNPNAKQPNIQSWARIIDLMIRIDNRKPDHIKSVIEFCQKDTFWMANILSTKKLRDKYDQLVLKMGANNRQVFPSTPGNGMKRFSANDESFFANPED
jgi:phage replication O-like protein O